MSVASIRSANIANGLRPLPDLRLRCWRTPLFLTIRMRQLDRIRLARRDGSTSVVVFVVAKRM